MNEFRPTPRSIAAMVALMAVLLLFMFYPVIERYENEDVLTKGIPWAGMRPAGEITPDFRLRQNLRTEHTQLEPHELDNVFCMDVLFATYGRRRNDGLIRLRVTAGDATDEQLVDVKNLIDNSLELICFPGVTFAQVYQRDAWIDIEGVSAAPGKSVTAVLSSTAGLPRATVNGAETDLTLVYVAKIRKDPGLYKFNSFVLIAFASLILTLLMVAAQPMFKGRPANAG